MRAMSVLILSMASFGLAACADTTKPPSNTTVSGLVKKATRVTPACYKIEYMFNQCGKDHYSLELAADDAKTWYADVSSTQIEEDDLRQVIGATVTIACYRAPDRQFTACSRQISSLVWHGRELTHPPKI